MKLFLRRLPLIRFLAKTLKVNKITMESSSKLCHSEFRKEFTNPGELVGSTVPWQRTRTSETLKCPEKMSLTSLDRDRDLKVAWSITNGVYKEPHSAKVFNPVLTKKISGSFLRHYCLVIENSILSCFLYSEEPDLNSFLLLLSFFFFFSLFLIIKLRFNVLRFKMFEMFAFHSI